MSGPVRTVVAILMAVGILMSIGDLFEVGGNYGYFAPYDVEFTLVPNVADAIAVTSVQQGSPAQRDGVRSGDVLHLEGLSWIERGTGSPDGNAFRATDIRTGKTVMLARHPRPTMAPARRAYTYSWLTLRIVIEIAGLTILLLRGATVAGAGLAVFMFFQQFSFLATPGVYLGRIWM